MERYICIHGHFYQPPRENPWLEAIEIQDSAYPYHDWNERITAEAYAPCAVSRILDGEQRIVEIVNNYSRISFNVGPTLLSWMEEKAPEVYQRILTADAESQRHFGGHGSAMAQPYNHMILPLANRRDRQTQIRWGLADFRRRFGREPEGMWLPETAVDLETLDLLAEQGIAFTVLSPHQAQRVRPLGTDIWQEVGQGSVDPSHAYRVLLSSGRSIAVFFYDGPISRAVAFEKLLSKGENLAWRLLAAFSDERTSPQLVHIATDGETYGHHHPHGDMALAYALHSVETSGQARLTNYSEFLERHPPTHEAQIFENSSWSCAHGVERWRSDCGCNSGRTGWNQQWRAPLRAALDWLRDELAEPFEEAARNLLRDPWAARDGYIEVLLDRSRENTAQFLARHSTRELTPEQKTRALKLLELQRHAMLMYTSCGWFFDELSGIETVQVMQYAGRAVQLAEELFGDHVEEQFLRRLECAKSNLSEHGDGRQVYEKWVKPAIVDLQKVGAHYAVSSLFENYGESTRTYCYAVERQDYRLFTAGKTRLALGRARVTSEIHWEAEDLTFGVLHLGDQNVSGGVRGYRGEEAYRELVDGAVEAFEHGEVQEVSRIVDRSFGLGTYTLKLLFRDEQHKILRIILGHGLRDAEAAYRHVYENYASLMAFVSTLGMAQPRRFALAGEFTLNADLESALSRERLDRAHVQALLDAVRRTGIPLHSAALEFALRRNLEAIARRFREQPQEVERLAALDDAVDLAQSLPFEVNLWLAQNLYYEVMRETYPTLRDRAEAGDEDARPWVERFRGLGERLRIRVD
ncbi:MAG TPA: DUF3536 domain-containing protein [Terriglobales bacterium]|nr:DUF3536 domain-containing protein [Terriglobales bacterium]